VAGKTLPNSQSTFLGFHHSSFTCRKVISVIILSVDIIYPWIWFKIGCKIAVFTNASTGTRNDVKAAIGKRRKVLLPEEDELSTMPGHRVRVHAHGRIEVLKEDLAASDEEIVRELGVEEELKQKRPTSEIGGGKKKAKLNLEDKYVDATLKRQDFEEEEAAEAAEAEAETIKKQQSRKKKSKKMRKVKK